MYLSCNLPAVMNDFSIALKESFIGLNIDWFCSTSFLFIFYKAFNQFWLLDKRGENSVNLFFFFKSSLGNTKFWAQWRNFRRTKPVSSKIIEEFDCRHQHMFFRAVCVLVIYKINPCRREMKWDWHRFGLSFKDGEVWPLSMQQGCKSWDDYNFKSPI